MAVKSHWGAAVAHKKSNPHVGSAFEDFLRDEGRLRASTVVAMNRVKAWRKRGGKIAARFPHLNDQIKHGYRPGGSN